MNASTAPLISVLFPVHNAAKTVSIALRSILQQSMSDFELIVVDDGSTDQSGEIVTSLAAADARIQIIHQPQQGVVNALNNGLAQARGEYIARMDADDRSALRRLEVQLQFLTANPELGGCSSFYREMDASGTVLWNCQMPTGRTQVKNHLVNHGNALVHPAAMYRRDLAAGIGGYRSLFEHAEDYDFWLRMLEHAPLDNIPEYLLDYRRSNGSISTVHREQQLLASIGARRSFYFRARGRPDPANLVDRISRDTLHAWGVEDRDIRQRMLEWITWHKRMLHSMGELEDPLLETLEERYAHPKSYAVGEFTDEKKRKFSVGIVCLDGDDRDIEKTIISVLRSPLVAEIFIHAKALREGSRRFISELSSHSPTVVRCVVGSYIGSWNLSRYMTALVEESTSNWISVVECGNVCVSGRFSDAANAFERNGCELVFGQHLTTVRNAVHCEPVLAASFVSEDAATLLIDSPGLAVISNLVFTKNVYQRLHGFAEFKFVSAWDFALRAALLRAAEFRNRPYVTTIRETTRPSRAEARLKGVETRLMGQRGLEERKHLRGTGAVEERLNILINDTP